MSRKRKRQTISTPRLMEIRQYRIVGERYWKRENEWSRFASEGEVWPEDESKQKKIMDEVNSLAYKDENRDVRLEIRDVFMTPWVEYEDD